MAGNYSPFGSVSAGADFDRSLARYVDAPTPEPVRGMVAPAPSGPTGWKGYAVAPVAGVYEGLGALGSGAQAAAKAVGADSLARSAADFAQRQRETAATWTNPDIQNYKWYDPRSLAYGVLKGAPEMATIAGAGLGAAAVAPESAALAGALGAGAAAYPFTVGGNVETAEAARGPLTQGDAAKSLALGVPEAALGAWMPARLAGVLEKGAAGKLAERALTGAKVIGPYQAAASAGQTLIAQQMGDPNRPIAERMHEMLQSAFTGGVTGAAMGAGIHALAKAKPADVTNEALAGTVNEALNPPAAQGGVQAQGLPRLPPPVKTDQLVTPLLPPPEPREPLDVRPTVGERPTVTPPPPTGLGDEELIRHMRGILANEDLSPDAKREALFPYAAEARSRGMTYDALKPKLLTAVPRPTDRPAPDEPAHYPTIAAIDAEYARGPRGEWNRSTQDARAPIELPDQTPPPPEPPPPAALPAPFPTDQLGAPRALPPPAPPHGPELLDTRPMAVRSPIEMPDKSAPLPQTIKQMHAEALADANVKKAPTGLFARQTLPEMQDAIRAFWEKAGPGKIARAMAGKFGLLDENGDLIPKKAPAKAEDPAAPPPEPPPAPAPPAAEPAKPTPLRAAIQAAQDSLDRLKGAAQPYPEPKNKQQEMVNKTYAKGLDQQQERLNGLRSALDRGDNAALQRPGEYDFVNDKLYTDNKMPKAAQAALDAHAELENAVLDAKEQEFPVGNSFARPAPEVDPAPAATDDGVTRLVSGGAEGKDVLDYLRMHGTPEQRLVAGRLVAAGVNPKIEFGAQDMAQPVTNLEPGQRAAGLYHQADNRVQLTGQTDLGNIVIHEAVHAGSVSALDAGGLAAREFANLFAEVKERLNPSVEDHPNAFKNEKEFMAEAFTPGPFQEFLRSTPDFTGKTSLWQRFKDTVAKLLGFEGSARTLLDRVMESGDRVLAENHGLAGGDGVYASPATPQGQNERAKTWFDTVSRAAPEIAAKATTVGGKVYKGALGFLKPSHIAETIAPHVPNAPKFLEATHAEETQRNVWNKVRGVAANAHAALPEAERKLHDVALAAPAFGIDPRKPWGEQAPELKQSGDVEDTRRVAMKAHDAYKKMSDAGRAALDARIDADHTTQLAAFTMKLTDEARTHFPELTKGFEQDPAALYQMAAEAHDSPAMSKQFWLQQMTQRTAALREAVKAGWAKLGVTPDQLANLKELAEAKRVPDPAAQRAARAVIKKLDPKTLETVEHMQRWVDGADAQVRALDDVPYVRLGRGNGDFYAAGHIPLDAAGLPSQKAIDAIKARLAKIGFNNVVIDRANTNDTVWIKAEDEAKGNRLLEAFQDLQKQGHLDQERLVHGGPIEQAVGRGVGPAVLRDIVETMKQSRPDTEGMDPKTAAEVNAAWDRQIQATTRDLMDILPDSSPSKIYARRRDIQGFSEEMGRSARDHDGAVSGMLARFGTAHDKGTTLAGMREDLKALNRLPVADLPMERRRDIRNAVEELMMRETHRPVSPPNGFVNALTWMNRASVIGLNPAYFVTIHTQDWTWNVPILGRTHGMVNAARETAKAEIPSFKIMRAMLKDPDWAYAGMRLKTLVDNGVDEGTAKYLVALDNMGKMTHGAFTQNQFHEEGDSLRARVANWSTAMGRYAEVQPRIKMALAARKLWRGEVKDGPLLDFAAKKIDEAQWDYSHSDTPREMTRMGTTGNLSPLVNQFMAYRTNAATRLYQEFHDWLGAARPGENAETAAKRKAEAGKFLAAHLAATTVISGALGMPMVAVLASVYDKLADTLTGSPNHDIMGSFRHYLEHTYGPGVGTAIARGVPAAIGVDLSRDGDQKIMPGSDAIIALTEKRRFEDAEKDFLQNFAGSTVGMAARAVLGMRDISNGDYLNGAVKLAPDALRGPTEAVRDMLYGYRDKGGHPIGITPRGVDIALTAMGLEPTELQTYNENKKVMAGLEERRRYQSQNITQHLSKALMMGQPDDYRYWLGQNAQYMQSWPGMRPPVADLARYIATHQRNAAIASGIGSGGMPTPVGIRPQNLTERGFFN